MPPLRISVGLALGFSAEEPPAVDPDDQDLGDLINIATGMPLG